MKALCINLAAAGVLALTGVAQAQQAPDASKPDPSAATTTGTTTSQSEMNRGVPGVNVDVGRNSSSGAVNADVDRNTDSSNLTDRTSTSGTAGASGSDRSTRAARADRG